MSTIGKWEKTNKRDSEYKKRKFIACDTEWGINKEDEKLPIEPKSTVTHLKLH